jgi:hypothetical protein
LKLPIMSGPDPEAPRPSLRPFLVSSTKSPLASPETPIHRLAAELQDQLHFPDPSPLYAVCGTLAANMLCGYPVWLMLIGPPESGKTELLKPLMDGPVVEAGDLSGKAALLSATRAKERTADATGGLLKRLHLEQDGTYRGMLVMLDFARTVLTADPATMRSTLGAIGMLHDRHWQRDVGTDGGQTITFDGRIGFIGATTEAIDKPQHQQANAEMGERCLYYRYPSSDGIHEMSSALDSPDGSGKSLYIKALFDIFKRELEQDGLTWQDKAPPRPLTEDEKRQIISVSEFCAHGRSPVERDKYQKYEICGMSRSALGPRIAQSLAQLLRGMERIGCTNVEIWKVLKQCAMDSLPRARAETIKLLAAAKPGKGVAGEVALALGLDLAPATRTLEDLRAHGLVKGNGAGPWELTDLAANVAKAFI